jgi:four helix bundle protein
MKSYRDLEIYKESRRLAIEVHVLSLSLPKHELYEEGSQVRRSSKAVTALNVESHGRKRYKAEYIKYLTYAQAECDETIVHLDFLIDTGSLTDKSKGKLLRKDYDLLSKKINGFTQWVEDNFIEKRSKSTIRNATDVEEIKNYKL